MSIEAISDGRCFFGVVAAEVASVVCNAGGDVDIIAGGTGGIVGRTISSSMEDPEGTV